MKLSELIKAAQELEERVGDLDILSEDHYLVTDIKEIKFHKSIEEWGIKKGDVFAQIIDTR
jgi:hypothetical protein